MATDYPEYRANALAANMPAGSDVYIALFLGDPIAGGIELTLTGYARVAFQDWVTTDLVGASDRSNVTDIVWPVITQVGSVDHWAIFDSSVGGILLRSGATKGVGGLPTTLPINGGDEPRILAGDLRVRLDD